MPSKATYCGSYCTLTRCSYSSEHPLVCKLSLAANLLPGANLYPVQHVHLLGSASVGFSVVECNPGGLISGVD